MSEQNPTEAQEVAARRKRRLESIQQFADKVATWPSWKLRDGYAQPETVRRAEEREKRGQQ